MKRSLQYRLSLALGGLVLVSGLLASVTSFFLAYVEAKEFQDDTLRQIALLSAGTGAWHPDGAPLEDPESRISIIRLPGDPRPAWLRDDVAPGFHTMTGGDVRLRVFLRDNGTGGRIAVAQSTDSRDEIAWSSAARTLLPMAALLPLMLWLLVRIVRAELAPVARLSTHLDEQPPERPEPLPEDGVPAEITPFLQAINRLLWRVGELRSRERRFIADAAHELRSPLTALSLQAQNLEQAATVADTKSRVAPLLSGIERARKLTGQLLDLARSQSREESPAMVDVSALARELIAEFLPLAEEKGIDLGLDEQAPLALPAAPEALRLVLKNSLENALKYTQEGGEVTIGLRTEGSKAFMEVRDNGPGIPPFERHRVFDPFYRLPGSLGDGSGLGLAIAREAAGKLHGELAILDNPHGRGTVLRYCQRCTAV